MMRVPPARTTAAVALLLLPFLGVACGGSSGGATATATKSDKVDVIDNKFSPEKISVAVGDTVTWTFKGKTVHNVTGPGFKSKTTAKTTFTHTFNTAGEVKYVCTVHPGMKGVVKVS
jgi:plastocyanin